MVRSQFRPKWAKIKNVVSFSLKNKNKDRLQIHIIYKLNKQCFISRYNICI